MNNILILTYWSYKDALIQTYTLPYVNIIKKKIGDGKIYLFTIEQNRFKMSDNEWDIEQKKLESQNIHLIRISYENFGFKMIFRLFKTFFSLLSIIKKNHINFIHCWCTPAGALGYLLSIFTKKTLIIDSYEPHAEAMVENGEWKKSSFKFKLLFWLEKKQSKRAKTVLALTTGMEAYAANKYTASFQNYYIKPALVNLEKFKYNPEIYSSKRSELNLNDKIVCLYAGKLGGIYLDEEVFDFFKIATEYWKNKIKIYLLTSTNQQTINDYIKKKSIDPNCIEAKFVDYNEIHTYFQIADFAINPVKSVPSKRYCTSIKDGEYWASGLPVVITKNISDDSNIIEQNNMGYVLKSLCNEEYNNACVKIDSILRGDRIVLRKKINTIAHRYRNFSIAEKIYEKIYN